MPSIRPISDLRNSANEISDFCKQTREPVFITRNGTGDMVVQSMAEYEQEIINYLNTLSQQAALRYYDLLIEEIESLSQMPFRCPKPRDIALAAKGYRYLIVENYLVFYVVVGDTVQIRRILYAKRNYRAILEDTIS